MSAYFVYVDSTDDARPFYVGKGDLRRVRQTQRNAKHAWISEKLGYRREVVIQTSIEKLAFDHEIELIAKLDTFTINYALRLDDIRCNFTRGGEGLSGHKDTPETKLKKHHAQLRSGQNIEIQAKKSLALRGRTFTKEVLIRMQRRTPVIQLSLDDVVIAQYDTVKEAQEATGAHMSCICKCCRGKVKSAAGFHWRYK